MTQKIIPLIDLRFEDDFEQKVLARWQKALTEKQFIGGAVIKELTEIILECTEAKHFIPTANGTDSLQIAFQLVST